MTAENLDKLEDAFQRPLMFICHSLSGIIVKRVCYDPQGGFGGF